MMLRLIEIVPAMVWSFLLGFAGWGTCFRLPEPITAWLLQGQEPNGIAVGVTRLLVTLLLIFSMLLLLSVIPLVLTSTQVVDVPGRHEKWNFLYGISFISSLVGHLSLGVIRGTSRPQKGRKNH